MHLGISVHCPLLQIETIEAINKTMNIFDSKAILIFFKLNYSFYSQIDSPFHKYTSRKKNAIDIYPILWKHLHNTYRQLVICLC